MDITPLSSSPSSEQVAFNTSGTDAARLCLAQSVCDDYTYIRRMPAPASLPYGLIPLLPSLSFSVGRCDGTGAESGRALSGEISLRVAATCIAFFRFRDPPVCGLRWPICLRERGRSWTSRVVYNVCLDRGWVLLIPIWFGSGVPCTSTLLDVGGGCGNLGVC
jgi:hypothetical protein